MHPAFFDPDSVTHPFKFSSDLLPNFSTRQDFGEEIEKDTILQNPNLGYDSVKVPDFSVASLKFISDILLEEELDENPNLEFSALQATEKSLYDALGLEEDYSPSYDHLQCLDSGYVNGDETPFELNHTQLSPVSNSLSSGSGDSFDDSGITVTSTLTRAKKNHERDEGGIDGGRSNKQQALTLEDYVEMKEFDDVLLNLSYNVQRTPIEATEKKGKTRGKKQPSNAASEDVDLSTLLSHCAQAVSSSDFTSAHKLLGQIRQHSTPYGDSLQRVSHYFANALESRLAGTGSTTMDARISSFGILKAYQKYVTAVPFKRMSYFFANHTISKLSENATTIHIIDFGVSLGMQWPCLISLLSNRPTGPPRLRITGIDHPQHGFRPAERVDATGRRLEGYCERFNVPFEYQGIVSQSWDNVKLEDLKIEKDELVFVNCMYRSGTLLDETVVAESPRDGFLRLVKKINPSLFLHGTVNSSLNAPFFVTRFREALFHYSSIFDVFEATMTREDHERLVVESEFYGKEAINVIACEGIERIQRPESYKQWQVRSTRAGLRQVPLDWELVSTAKTMVKRNYHKDFVVDEDRHWMLQGWKGRLFSAFSIWQPNN